MAKSKIHTIEKEKKNHHITNPFVETIVWDDEISIGCHEGEYDSSVQEVSISYEQTRELIEFLAPIVYGD